MVLSKVNLENCCRLENQGKEKYDIRVTGIVQDDVCQCFYLNGMRNISHKEL